MRYSLVACGSNSNERTAGLDDHVGCFYDSMHRSKNLEHKKVALEPGVVWCAAGQGRQRCQGAFTLKPCTHLVHLQTCHVLRGMTIPSIL